MSRYSNSIVRDAHAYTRSDTPWRMDDDINDSGGVASDGAHRSRRRLFRYLAGGGLGGIGRSVAEEEADAKRTRFLVKAFLLALVWLWLWF